MTTRYSAPSVEAIQEDSEDESTDALKVKEDDESPNEHSYRRLRSTMDVSTAPARPTTAKERERERPRRKHRSKEGGSKRQSRSQGKNKSLQRAGGLPTRDSGSEGHRRHHRRTYSNRSTSSTSSEEEEEEPVQDHREVLAAARSKLTSPSMISTFTSLTSSTNTSSGSSGSNSTVTQASITKRSNLGKSPETSEAPLSPAVPDPPNVFAFLDNQSTVSLSQKEEEEVAEDEEIENGHEPEREEGYEEDEHDVEGHESQWLPEEARPSYNERALPPHLAPDHGSASTSSASSSFHGSDHFSEPAADIDTDRSPSPERSVRDHPSDPEHEAAAQTDRASARMASQMAAAQQRQDLYGSMHNYGTPNMPRGNTPLPHLSSTALSPRHTQPITHRSLPRAEKLPVTGYELLASRLSSYHNSDLEDGTVIKPIYRKFAALNHRLLLHLQDELSELEEHLHRLDNADTQTRRAGLGGRVVPASRRAAALQGGELQWHKTDILGRIGFKLAQYNQALASFNTTQSLNPPAPTDVDAYREYLSTEHPIAEVETRFLDPSDDLVSICSSIPAPSPPLSNQSQSQPLSRSESQISATPSSCRSTTTSDLEPQSRLQGLAIAIAVAILVPILTFSVIPGFIGRITVAGLVASGVVFALMQAGVVGNGCFGREGLVCGGIYGGVMIVIAGIVA